jgi:hypothetical protein
MEAGVRRGRRELTVLAAVLFAGLCGAIPAYSAVVPAGVDSIAAPFGADSAAVPADSAAVPAHPDSATVPPDSLPGEVVADTTAGPEPYAWLEDDSLSSLPFGQPVPVRSLPAFLRVLTRGDIDRTGARTLGELFAWLEDSEILQGGFTLDEQYLRLRGSVPQEVVVMVDGVRANEPGTGIMDLRDVPVESISRIEILSGPMANLLAAEATEALIMITTCRHPGGDPASRISILDGTGSVLLVEGSFSKKIRETGYMNLTASRFSLDGLAENIPSTNLAVWARAGVDVKGVMLESWVRRTAVDREEEDADDSLGIHEAFTYGFGARKALREGLVLSGLFSRTAHQFEDDFDFPIERDSESGRTTFDISLLADRGDGRYVKAGFEWERSRLEPPDGDWQRLLRSSGYGMGSFIPARHLSLLAGVRVDRYRDEPVDASAGLSLGLTALESVQPYFSFSLGSSRILAPSQLPGQPTPGRKDPSAAFEIGSRFSPLERLEARISYTRREFEHGGTIFLNTPSREDTVYVRGFPQYGSWRRSFQATARYVVTGGFSAGLGYMRASFDEYMADWLTEVSPDPETILSLSGELRRKLYGDNLSFEGSFFAKRLYEGRMNLLDFIAGIRIVDVLIFYSGRNMLDERYEPYEGFAPHGRYAKWGFTWDFLD